MITPALVLMIIVPVLVIFVLILSYLWLREQERMRDSISKLSEMQPATTEKVEELQLVLSQLNTQLESALRRPPKSTSGKVLELLSNRALAGFRCTPEDVILLELARHYQAPQAEREKLNKYLPSKRISAKYLSNYSYSRTSAWTYHWHNIRDLKKPTKAPWEGSWFHPTRFDIDHAQDKWSAEIDSPPVWRT